MGSIRLVLALSVAIWHIPNPPFHWLNASVAVTSFYIVSGFYMAMVINQKYASDDRPWVMRFYLARLLRLYPVYLFMLVLPIVAHLYTGTPDPFTRRLNMSMPEQLSLVFANLFFFGQDLHQTVIQSMATKSGPTFIASVHDWFSPDYFYENLMLIGQAWSLAVELMFYLIAPFVLRSWLRTLALLVVALCLRWVLLGLLGYISWVWGYYFFPGCLCMFLLGSASYHLHQRLPAGDWQKRVGQIALTCLALWFGWNVIESGIVLPYGVGTSIDRPVFWVYYILFTAAIPFIFAATSRSAVDRAIGETSYPLYLSHSLVLGIASRLSITPSSGLTTAAILILLVLVAWAMNMIIEQPIERWRQRL